MLETKRETVELTATTGALARAMRQTEQPTAELVAAFELSRVKARQAKDEYRAQQAGLAALSSILRETGGDIDVLRDRQQRFAATLAKTTAELNKIDKEADQASAAFTRLGSATAKAASNSTRFNTAVTGTAGVLDRQASAARRTSSAMEILYGKSRRAMSIQQRLRGEVLALTQAYLGFYAGIQLVSRTVETQQTLEAAGSRLNVVFDGDVKSVADEMDFLRRTADRLGIQFGALADDYTKFAVATKGTIIEGQNTRKVFLSVAEAGRVNKLSVDQMKGVFTALTQIVSKGKVQMEELRQQLGDRLPGAIQIMADALGVTTEQLFEMVEAGEVSSSALIKFADELDKRFGSQLAAALTTTTTKIGRFQNAIFGALAAFGEAGVIDGFNNLLDSLVRTLKSGEFAAFASRMGAVVESVLTGIGSAGGKLRPSVDRGHRVYRFEAGSGARQHCDSSSRRRDSRRRFVGSLRSNALGGNGCHGKHERGCHCRGAADDCDTGVLADDRRGHRCGRSRGRSRASRHTGRCSHRRDGRERPADRQAEERLRSRTASR